MSIQNALQSYRNKDFVSAAAHFESAVNADPNNVLAWKGLTIAKAKCKDLEAAQIAADSWARLLPEEPRAWRIVGGIAFEEDRLDQALSAFQRVAYLRPSKPRAHYAVAVCLYHMDRHREAGESLGRAVGLKPDFAEGHYLLGLVHLSLDDASSAGHQVAVLRKLDPELAESLQRAVAPHRQSAIMLGTIIVISLWLGAGKWFVPRELAQAWQIGGFALFGIAFLAYRHFHKQAHPDGDQLPDNWRNEPSD